MRSQNMGWGQIAQKLGLKLGPVIAGMKSANKGLTATATATSKGNGAGAANGHASSSSGKSIVSASGKSHGNSAQGISNGKAPAMESSALRAKVMVTPTDLTGAVSSTARVRAPVRVAGSFQRERAATP